MVSWDGLACHRQRAARGHPAPRRHQAGDTELRSERELDAVSRANAALSWNQNSREAHLHIPQGCKKTDKRNNLWKLFLHFYVTRDSVTKIYVKIIDEIYMNYDKRKNLWKFRSTQK